MVAYTGDGLVSGYSPSTKQLESDVYHLATNGTVDANAITRLDSSISDGSYPNRMLASAPIQITSGDVTANSLGSGGRSLGVNMYIAQASAFGIGVVPSPSQIRAAALANNAVWRSDTSHTTAGSRDYSITGPRPLRGLRYWIALIPMVRVSGNPASSDLTPSGMNTDSVGRAISFWSGRTPNKPVITSPASGSTYEDGDTITITINTSDPDESLSPDDADRYNRDVAGVEWQYAAYSPGATPAWQPLPFSPTSGGIQRRSWAIAGSYNDNDFAYLRKNFDGYEVQFGAEEYGVGIETGLIPFGSYQIRCRVFEYGHPYPAVASPIGSNVDTPTNFSPTDLENSFSQTVSPWSDPIYIQAGVVDVPAPLAISPRDDNAVTYGLDVRLFWKYLNTANPGYDQDSRVVQIREVGDPNWTTVVNGSGSLPYVDIVSSDPSDDDSPTIWEYLLDGNFELGTVDGWIATHDGPGSGTGRSASVTNENTSGQAKSGSRYLRIHHEPDYIDATVSYRRRVTLRPVDTSVTFTGWFYPNRWAEYYVVRAEWVDASDSSLGFGCEDFIYKSPGLPVPEGTDWGGYQPISTGDMDVPSGAVYLDISITADERLASPGTPYPAHRIDAMSIKGTKNAVEGFALSVGKHYEWRVKTTDTFSSESAFSLPARFWIVPNPNTGPTRPAPSFVPGGTLGCGTHRVEIYRRGGKKRVGEIRKASSINWGRLRDDISTAQIVIKDWDLDCGNLLASLQSWAYEVVIWRETGFSSDRVWEGPITLLRYERDQVTIEAKDVMGYAYRRIIKQGMDDTGTGDTVVNRALRILQNAFAPDNPAVLEYMQVITNSDDAREYRKIPAYSRTAYEEVDDMAANAGLDYTCVGRSIILWGTKHRIGTLPEFRDKDLGAVPIVTEYGMSMANRYAVSDGNGVWGEATRLDEFGNDDVYGLVEMLSSTWASDQDIQTDTYTEAGLETMRQGFATSSERSIADRYPPPVVVRIPDNTTLSPDTEISIQHLVPGVVIPLRSEGTLRTVVGNQKLDSVRVVESEGKEVISIVLSPFDRDSLNVEQGDG